MVSLRLVQGLALGGEYGGAATYVAEHAPRGRRGYATSWIQTTATLGFFLSLAVIALCRTQMDAATFADWGWRVPFLVSLVLLVFSVYIRLKLNESPIFTQMKAEGKGSKSPLTDSFLRFPTTGWSCSPCSAHRRPGRGVVHGPVLRPVLPLITLKLDFLAAYTLMASRC
jgi:MFS family permease